MLIKMNSVRSCPL